MIKANELYSLLRGLSKGEILKLSRQYCVHRHTVLAHPECLRSNQLLTERIGFLDIEASSLNMNYGIIHSYCIKELNGRITERVVTKKEILSQAFDKELMRQFCQDIRKFDRVVTFYGWRFDLPAVRTRAVRWGLDFPLYSEVRHTDVWKIMRDKFKLSSNSLRTCCQFFGIKAKNHPLNPEIWMAAMVGDEKALHYILEHNREDVRSTEELYKKVMLYVPQTKTSI